jgi:hypothetical protein
VHAQGKFLSPAAESFRYFMLEGAEAYLIEHFGRFWVSPAEQVPGAVIRAL